NYPVATCSSFVAPLSLHFFSQCSGDPRDLHSFPTRRSSDLGPRRLHRAPADGREHQRSDLSAEGALVGGPGEAARDRAVPALLRSEEHTSELQSRGHLVCRLLLEKKKNGELGVLTPPPHASA